MIKRLLVANRGEIAIRISRTAADLGVATVAIYAADDHLSLHTRHADESVNLGAQGVAAYLNSERIVQIAKDTGCDAVHPGYGFLSESAEFAQSCEDANLIYVGPTPATLNQFGDKAAARSLAEQCDVPVFARHQPCSHERRGNRIYAADQGQRHHAKSYRRRRRSRHAPGVRAR